MSVPPAVNYLRQELVSTGLGLVAERQQSRDPSWGSSVQFVNPLLLSQAAVLTCERSVSPGLPRLTMLGTRSRPHTSCCRPTPGAATWQHGGGFAAWEPSRRHHNQLPAEAEGTA